MPGARHVTRRLFLGGGLKAPLVAGLGARLSLGDLLAGGRARAGTSGGPAAARRRQQSTRGYDGELIEESYSVAHRLRDGTLEIPAALSPEGPLHDAIVIGGGRRGALGGGGPRRRGAVRPGAADNGEY